MFRRLALFLMVFLAAVSIHADTKKATEKTARAEAEFRRHNVAGAEKLLRDAIKEDPNSLNAHNMLANLLASTNRNSEAAREFGRVLELDAQQNKLSEGSKRRVIDGQAVAYAESGDLQRAKAIYLAAIEKDPDYSMYNYNLACVFAELHDLDTAIPYLKKFWAHRDNLPSDVPVPDPRKDNSFRPYLDDPKFQEVVRNMVQ